MKHIGKTALVSAILALVLDGMWALYFHAFSKGFFWGVFQLMLMGLLLFEVCFFLSTLGITVYSFIARRWMRREEG
jgi:hypothetical protein